jgi:hypothetical protein
MFIEAGATKNIKEHDGCSARSTLLARQFQLAVMYFTVAK